MARVVGMFHFSQVVLLSSLISKVSVESPSMLSMVLTLVQSTFGVATTVHMPPKQPPAGVRVGTDVVDAAYPSIARVT
jgi:hypothetical protein